MHSESGEDGLGDLRKLYDSSYEWAKNLVECKLKLEKQLEEKSLDLMNTTQQARNLRGEVLELQKQLQEQKIASEKLEQNRTKLLLQNDSEASRRAGYVIVLIDGDGMIFADDYMKSGMNGGNRAANALLRQAWDTAKRILPVNTQYFVKMRVFANMDGLAGALCATGVVSSPTMLRAFAHGFTQAKEMSNFIDVGTGKDMADEKLKAELRCHLDSPMCRLVILGGSHDNGYARVLNFVTTHQQAETNKIILLEGTPFAKELSALPFQRIKFQGLFRSKKLAYSVKQQPAAPQLLNYSNPQLGVPSFTSTEATNGPIPVNEAALQKIRKLNPGPCFPHYLKSSCKKNNNCKFSHAYILNTEEIQAIRKRAGVSLIPCPLGESCTNKACFRPHETSSTPSSLPPPPYHSGLAASSKDILLKLSQMQPSPCFRFFASGKCGFDHCPLSHSGNFTLQEIEAMKNWTVE